MQFKHIFAAVSAFSAFVSAGPIRRAVEPELTELTIPPYKVIFSASTSESTISLAKKIAVSKGGSVLGPWESKNGREKGFVAELSPLAGKEILEMGKGVEVALVTDDSFEGNFCPEIMWPRC